MRILLLILFRTCSFVHPNEILYFMSFIKVSTQVPQQNPSSVEGVEAMGANSCRRWYFCFKDGNCSLDDQPKGLDMDAAFTENPFTTARELSDNFTLNHTTVPRELK